VLTENKSTMGLAHVLSSACDLTVEKKKKLTQCDYNSKIFLVVLESEHSFLWQTSAL